MPDVTDVRLPRELFDFLVGEGPLYGCWFGDRPADAKGAFWWRKELRKCAALEPAPKPAGGGWVPHPDDPETTDCDTPASVERFRAAPTPPAADAQDVGELVAALEPFANWDGTTPRMIENDIDWPDHSCAAGIESFTYGDVRRARRLVAAYKRSTTDGQ